eukprot:TRINITY_DN75059_c0_g1_i1.p2 TRINITY_DN75059_c0_g1~~TRINITY_DN75059_c0_g1_i1.p2  ORF type:complete len:277 (-),score=59.48 TRINITY_DN75059_c0_g1_i1:131-961(-)
MRLVLYWCAVLPLVAGRGGEAQWPAERGRVNASGRDERRICLDNEGWTNGWKPCYREELGDETENCEMDEGWTCAGYVAKGWCADRQCLSARDTGGVYVCGVNLKNPEEHCCACGKAFQPVPPTCEELTCSKINELCRCTKDCEYYGNCCQGYWDLCTPEQKLYEVHFDKNAFSPYGADDLDDDESAPEGLHYQECKDRCTADWQCACVSYKRRTGKCWKRANCDPDGWTSEFNKGFTVFVKIASPFVPIIDEPQTESSTLRGSAASAVLEEAILP